MKTFLPAFLGAFLGTSAVLAVVVVLAESDRRDDERAVGPLSDLVEEARRDVDGRRAQRGTPNEIVVRLENPVLRLEGDMRAVLEPDERLAAALDRASDQDATAFAAQAEPRAIVHNTSEYWESQASEEVTEGPLTFHRLHDGTFMYRGEQKQLEDGSWVRHGNWQAWHDDGSRHEDGAYREGVEHGPWEWWYANGNRMARGTWYDGKRVGNWTFWHEGGELMMTGQYDERGLATGNWTYYHENGRKASEGEMVNDHPSGRWTSWDEAGVLDLERSGVYEKGERVSR